LLILGILGVWRITHLLHAEDGPREVVAKLRRLAGSGVLGQAMDCFYCLSLWVAAPFAMLIGQGWLERALLWPALSAGAIALDLAVRRLKPEGPTIVHYAEDEAQSQARQEESNVQLWTVAVRNDDGRNGADRHVARGEPSTSAAGAGDDLGAVHGAGNDGRSGV
jgi:hypothetical protein